MPPLARRLVFWAVPALLVAAALAFAFRPTPMAVDIVRAERAPMLVTVDEEGETRIEDVYTVSAPIRGRVLRIGLEEGDAVTADETVVARIEPADPAFLDIRSEAEARAAVRTAEAALTLAEAGLEEARAERDYARAELRRIRRLAQSGTVPQSRLDEAERLYRTRAAAVETAKAAVRMREAELEAARIRLERPPAPGDRPAGCPCVAIRAPADGQVLRVLHESEGVVEQGAPLVEIGDPSALEIVADVLSADAVRIEPGQRVVIEGWGGAAALEGRVATVEPFGFTRVSALGIEEQRVNLVIEITSPREDWQRLGHGFRVEVRVVLWETEDTLQVPLTALFREGTGWAVFAVEDGRARLTPVEIGHRTDTAAEILSGLEPGTPIIRYPSGELAPGSRVARR
jgi:HlyD family secretion protein